MTMIEERYVSFEIAKLLKEKGFNEPCRSYFIDDTGDYRRCAFEIKNKNCSSEELLRPTLYMTMEWLREKGIYIYVQPTKYVGGCLYGFQAVVEDGREGKWNKSIHHAETHEGGVDAALKYSLENLV